MWKTLWSAQQQDFVRRKLLQLAFVVTTVGVVAISGTYLRASKGASESVQLQTKTVIPTQTVRFTVYPEGIHPATATVHKGVVSIAIEDLAGTEDGVLIERMNGSERSAVGKVKRVERHWRGHSLIELRPGVYRLRVPDRQIEEGQITVEP